MDSRLPNSLGSKPEDVQVRQQHQKSDVDSGPRALHHTLGKGPGQAAPGILLRNVTAPIAFGHPTVTTDGSGLFTVAHKLGKIPSGLFVTADSGAKLVFRTIAYDKTNVTFEAYNVVTNALWTAQTFMVFWIAIA